MITFGSVCSGIEAASVAWRSLGWRAAWLAEIEPFPCAVLAHHYPGVPNLGDMTLLPSLIRGGEVAAPDVFCGGTPCQAFSIAGLRKSLDDARGNLSLTFCEIANEIDATRSTLGLPPAVVLWENVPGVLSTKDNAFGCFLGALAGENRELEPAGGKWTNAGCVFGPTRTVAWRTLDAQYFGVAQRRRRVFVVASARTGFDPAAVLFEFDGVRRGTAPSRETGESVAGTTTAGAFTDGSPTSTGCGLDPIGGRIADVNSMGHAQVKVWPAEIASTLDTSFGAKQGLDNQHVNAGCPPFAPTIARCIATREGSSQDWESTTMVAQPIAFHHNAQACQLPSVGSDTSISNTLTCSQQAAVATAMRVRRLTPVECERLQGFPDGYTQIPWRTYQEAARTGVSYETILALKGERLRGPDYHLCPDTPRYKALGNSWAVPVVRWIGLRIDNALIGGLL